MEQLEREQPLDLGASRDQSVQQAGEPNGLASEVEPQQSKELCRARQIPLVEDEVQDGEDGAESFGEVRRDRHRDPGVADLALGPHDSLRQSRFRDDESRRDLRRREPADEP